MSGSSRRVAVAGGLCVLLFVFSTCTNPVTPVDSGTATPSPTDEPNPLTVTRQPAVVVPDEYDGPGSVTVLESAVDPPERLGRHFVPVGPVWDVTIDGEEHVTFAEGVARVRFPFDGETLGRVGLIDEFVVFVSDDGTTWERVERTFVEESDGDRAIVAETTHFSLFVPTAAAASGSTVVPAPGMGTVVPAGIAGSGGAVFALVDEGFRYYQDRDYSIVPASESTANADTFEALGLDGSIGISTFNGDSAGGPVSAHKHYAGTEYIVFEAHMPIDVYVLYDTRGGTGLGDTSRDAPWLTELGFGSLFDGVAHYLQTTDPVGLYRVYRRSYETGELVILHGNRHDPDPTADPSVDTGSIQTNYWAIIKPKGNTDSDSSEAVTADRSYEDQRLKPSDSSGYDYFGYSMDAHGDYLIVGAQQNEYGAYRAGAAFIFEHDGGGQWVERAMLTEPTPRERNHFGTSVAIKGSLAVVGSPWLRNEEGTRNGAGAAHVFERDPVDGWSHVQMLEPSNGRSGANFGLAPAVDGDTIIVGAWHASTPVASSTGAAYVFERDVDGVWQETQILYDEEETRWGSFGGQVALEGDYVVISDTADSSDDGISAGAVFVFHRDAGGTWSRIQRLVAPQRRQSDEFGWRLVLDGDTLAVSVRETHGESRGAVHVYRQQADGTFVHEQLIRPATQHQTQLFGWGLDVEGDRILVGAHGDNDWGTGAGSAFRFDRDGAGTWTQVGKLSASDGQLHQRLGMTTAISGDTLFVSGHDVPDAFAGMVLVFSE